MRYFLMVLMFLQFWAGPGWAQNDHALGPVDAEQRARDHDAHNPYVSSGCLHLLPASSLTIAAEACDAYVVAGPAGQEELAFARQVAVALTIPDVTGTHWIGIDESTTAARAGYTRPVFGGRYLLQQSATQPAVIDGVLVVTRLVVAGSVLTEVTPFAFRSPGDANVGWNAITNWGAVCDGVTDDTAAILAAGNALHNQGASDVGGTLIFPQGVCVISSWAPDFNGLVVQGQGHFATTIKCTDAASAGDDCVTLTNVARYHWSDLAIDANEDKTSTLRFVAEVASSNTEHLFTNVRFIGATTNTINFDDAGGGSVNDISHITFDTCYVRSAAPSNAQVRNNAANGLDIRFIGGQISAPGAGSPFNVDLQTGQITLFDVFLAGSTSFDINAAGGQFQSFGGRTESTGHYLHTLSTDPTNDQRGSLHMVQGLQDSSTGSAACADATSCSVHHEARRGLILQGNFWNDNVMYGQSGGAGNNPAVLIANGNAFASGSTYVSAATTNGLFYAIAPALPVESETPLADIEARDIQMRKFFTQTIPAFTNADTTPDVSAGIIFTTDANVGITTFDGASRGQVITVRCADGTTTLLDAAPLFLAGAFNCTTNDAIQLYFDATSWYEISRSVN